MRAGARARVRARARACGRACVRPRACARAFSSVAPSTASSVLLMSPLLFFFVLATDAESADATSRCSADSVRTSTCRSSAACVADAVSSCLSSALARFSAAMASGRLPAAKSSLALPRAARARSPSWPAWASTDSAAWLRRSAAVAVDLLLLLPRWPKSLASIVGCARAPAEAEACCCSPLVLLATCAAAGVLLGRKKQKNRSAQPLVGAFAPMASCPVCTARSISSAIRNSRDFIASNAAFFDFVLETSCITAL